MNSFILLLGLTAPNNEALKLKEVKTVLDEKIRKYQKIILFLWHENGKSI